LQATTKVLSDMDNHKYYFYILYSEIRDKYYVGFTSDLDGRIRRHNSKHKGFTSKGDDWTLVYTEHYQTKSEALAREQQVKSWKSKEIIRAMIKG
jgi:putative endonuclease